MGSADCAQLNQTRDASADRDSGCNASLCGLYTVKTALTARYIPSTSSRLRRYLHTITACHWRMPCSICMFAC